MRRMNLFVAALLLSSVVPAPAFAEGPALPGARGRIGAALE